MQPHAHNVSSYAAASARRLCVCSPTECVVAAGDHVCLSCLHFNRAVVAAGKRAGGVSDDGAAAARSCRRRVAARACPWHRHRCSTRSGSGCMMMMRHAAAAAGGAAQRAAERRRGRAIARAELAAPERSRTTHNTQGSTQHTTQRRRAAASRSAARTRDQLANLHVAWMSRDRTARVHELDVHVTVVNGGDDVLAGLWTLWTKVRSLLSMSGLGRRDSVVHD